MHSQSYQPRSSLLEYLLDAKTVEIRQNVDIIEIFGYEAANTYTIHAASGEMIGMAVERATGLRAFFGLQIFGH